MQVGVGLPGTIPGAHGELIFEWACRADEAPFSCLGVLDRQVYDSYDPLITLSAVAGITRHVKLATTIIIGPLRNNALLAKAAASLDALSGGRLVLGLAVGARKDDYDASGVEYRDRGKRLSEQLSSFRSIWEDNLIGPETNHQGGPKLLIGGLSDQSYARMVRYTDGYVHGGGPPRAFSRAADKAFAAWSDAGRPGKPQLWAQGYFALGDTNAINAGYRYLKDYYAFTGPFAERIASGLLTSPQSVAQFIRGYQDAGCDELVLFPTLPDMTQLDRLAEILHAQDIRRTE
ncbi:MAG TPA: LLM class flavin-dependent oxidoreductase [Ktedonobacteraceae bacterium]|nr:LLM class flavin-dependent oxidoreductase [Ktedonobacteraceae bacterium]